MLRPCFLLIVAAHLHFRVGGSLYAGRAFSPVSVHLVHSTTILSGTTAAAAFGLITSVSQIGAFVGPSLLGYLNDRTHSILPGIAVIGVSFVMAASIFSLLRLAPPRPNESCTCIVVGEAIDSSAP
jgi:MFS family permease